MKSLYLYPLWVRVWHWLNALLFLVMIVTGASMHFAGLSWLLSFKTAVALHNAAGILLALGWVGFVVGNRITDNGRHYRVRFRGLVGRLLTQGRYYAHGIFQNAPHPFTVSADEKLNTLQQLSYLGVMYGLMPPLILSGLAFLFAPQLPETLFGIGTLWIVALIHLTLAYALALFLLVHVYIITTGETVLTNLRAMLTGWHRESDHPSADHPSAERSESPS